MTIKESIAHARATGKRQLADWLEELLIWRKNGVKNKDCMVCKHCTKDICEHIAKCEQGKYFEPLDGIEE